MAPIPFDPTKISEHWSRVAAKLPFKKLDKYQVLNGLFDILALIAFAIVSWQSQTQIILIGLLFVALLAFMAWCMWLCAKIAGRL